MKKIIITETLKTFLEGEHTFILRSDIQIFIVSSSREILDIHRSNNVDLVIIDFFMPDIDGDKLCAMIRSDEDLKDVSIIIACPGEEEAIDRCVYCGANALITKPVYRQELISKSSELLNIPQRESFRVLMNITAEGKSRDVFYCTSKDISTSGMLVETNKALKKDDIITFSFLLRLNRITINGKVLRVIQRGPNNFQYGLKFINMDQQSRSLIEEYIKIRRIL